MTDAQTLNCTGEIVTWNFSGVKIRHAQVVQSLRDAGLADSAARKLLPRHAFSRACQALRKERVIKKIEEREHVLKFQFTKEVFDGLRYEYEMETTLELSKDTGDIHCPIHELQVFAQSELDRCMEERTCADITRIVQKLFEENADLFSIRDQGGAYFVPKEHREFLDKIRAFISGVGGTLRSFPILDGTDSGKQSVKEAVSEGIQSMIHDHQAAIEAFTDDTRTGTMERRAERLQQTKHKIAAYAAYLEEQGNQLTAQLDALQDELRRKIDSEHQEHQGEETAPTLFGGAADDHGSQGPPELAMVG